ncbi:MAG: hypothetical protein ACI909_002600 [Planctomycetota bacterium]|jgi:hypothetical protein
MTLVKGDGLVPTASNMIAAEQEEQDVRQMLTGANYRGNRSS